MKNEILVTADGILQWNAATYRCALGRGGISREKKEGDGTTPAGIFTIRKIFYRADRIDKPKSVFETIPLSKQDGWCDDVKQAEYNRHITLPHLGRYETLWRDDDIYNILVVLGYNDDPPVVGKGSAIFMHIARANYMPTDGCIALAYVDLLQVLATCTTDTVIHSIFL